MGPRHNVFVAGLALAAVVVRQGISAFGNPDRGSIPSQIFTGWLLFVFGGSACTLLHISTQSCSKYTTTKQMILLYFYGLLFKVVGVYRGRQFEKASKNPHLTQEKTLLGILRKNANTEYARKIGLGKVTNVAEFQACHPLSNYEQFQDYIERTAKGEDNVLLPTRPVQLVLTSGTTGNPKIIPLSKERKLQLPLIGMSLLQNVLSKNSTTTTKSMAQKMCTVYTHPAEYWSEAGIVKSAFTRFTAQDILPIFCSPVAGYRIRAEREAMYVHAVFALRDDNLNTIQAPFCSMICNFFKLIESQWRDIVQDIETGLIKADLDIPSDVRNELNKALVPDPTRAGELRREFERGFDGIATRVWPYMTCLFGVVSPALQMYADKLEKMYAKGVLLHSSFYISSEGLLGVNIWPTDREHKFHYVLVTDVNLYEFIPLQNSHEDQPETKLIEDVVKGESYELVITTMDGLYRFRFGDVVKIAGFYNKTPIIEFQFRKGDLMNLRGEKISEDCIFRALTDTLASMEAQLVDYSCAESHLVDSVKGTLDSTPHYVIFAELNSTAADGVQKQVVDSLKFDTILRNQVAMYDYYRGMDSLGPASLVFVRPGSFKALRTYMIANSTTSPMQFKMPRKLRKKEWAEVLLKDI